MCVSGAVMAGIGLLGTVLSTSNKMRAQMQASDNAQKTAQYNSAIQSRNADLAEMQAADTIAQGQKDQEQARLEYKAKAGQMAANFGAGNVALSSGSALDLLEDTVEVGELGALDIGANAQRKSQDYLRSAADARNQAFITNEEGKNASANLGANLGSTLIGGVGSVGGGLQDMFSKASPSVNTVKSAAPSGLAKNTSSSPFSAGYSSASMQNNTSTFGKKNSPSKNRGPSYF